MNRTTAIRSAVLTAALLVSLSIAQAATTAPQSNDITASFAAAELNVANLAATEVGGIVILRGQAANAADAARAAIVARELGYARVANLIRVIEPVDDAAIQRLAERELSRHRGLDGSKISISSQHGIVNLAGRVSHELQKDMAVTLIRNVDGVRGVTSNLQK